MAAEVANNQQAVAATTEENATEKKAVEEPAAVTEKKDEAKPDESAAKNNSAENHANDAAAAATAPPPAKVVQPKITVHKADFEKDVIYLYQFSRTPFLPSISPYCLKVETWLRLAGLKYEVCTHILAGRSISQLRSSILVAYAISTLHSFTFQFQICCCCGPAVRFSKKRTKKKIPKRTENDRKIAAGFSFHFEWG